MKGRRVLVSEYGRAIATVIVVAKLILGPGKSLPGALLGLLSYSFPVCFLNERPRTHDNPHQNYC
jgi:hypothetical protein